MSCIVITREDGEVVIVSRTTNDIRNKSKNEEEKNCSLVERNKGAADPRWTPSFPEMRALHNSQTGFRARRKLGQKLVPRSSSGAPCGQQQGRGGSAMRSEFKADFPPGISHALMASVVPMRISAGVRYIHMHAQTHDYPNACAKPWSRALAH